MQFVVAAIALLIAFAQDRSPAAPWTANLAEIRAAAAKTGGDRPLRINVLKFAESRRTKNFSVRGAAPEPSVQARTAFQIVFPDHHIMVDAGMDEEVHRFFGRGVEEPYDPRAAAQTAGALESARLVVVTHEHGDHVAGVIRSPRADLLAPKTILTREQVNALLSTPQMPQIRLTAERASRFRIIDYDRYFPIAAGVALIKSPGHTRGSQMVYVAVASGREYLLIGDVAWHMDGVRRVVGKDAPWITEDEPAVLAQLRWLNDLSRSEPRVVIVASHDDEQHKELTKTGLVGASVE